MACTSKYCTLDSMEVIKNHFFLKDNSILGLQFCDQDRPQIGILYSNPSVIYVTGSLNHAWDIGSLLVDP